MMRFPWIHSLMTPLYFFIPAWPCVTQWLISTLMIIPIKRIINSNEISFTEVKFTFFFFHGSPPKKPYTTFFLLSKHVPRRGERRSIAFETAERTRACWSCCRPSCSSVHSFRMRSQLSFVQSACSVFWPLYRGHPIGRDSDAFV